MPSSKASCGYSGKAGEFDREKQVILLTLFSYAPILKQVYIFREGLTSIFNQALTKSQAVIELNIWINKIQALGLTCFDSFVGTLQKWMNEISNYFIQRQSSGFVEGLNNKIKVIKRRCYEHINLGRLFQHIWLDVKRPAIHLLALARRRWYCGRLC